MLTIWFPFAWELHQRHPAAAALRQFNIQGKDTADCSKHFFKLKLNPSNIFSSGTRPFSWIFHCVYMHQPRHTAAQHGFVLLQQCRRFEGAPLTECITVNSQQAGRGCDVKEAAIKLAESSLVSCFCSKFPHKTTRHKVGVVYLKQESLKGCSKRSRWLQLLVQRLTEPLLTFFFLLTGTDE